MERPWPRPASALLDPCHFSSRGRKCLIYLSSIVPCFNCWLFVGVVGEELKGLIMEIHYLGGVVEMLRIALHELLVLERWWQMVLGRWFGPKDLMLLLHGHAASVYYCIVCGEFLRMLTSYPLVLRVTVSYITSPSENCPACLLTYLESSYLPLLPIESDHFHLCPSPSQDRMSLRERWDQQLTQEWVFLSGLLGAPAWTDLLFCISLHLAASNWPGELLILTFDL